MLFLPTELSLWLQDGLSYVQFCIRLIGRTWFSVFLVIQEHWEWTV